LKNNAFLRFQKSRTRMLSGGGSAAFSQEGVETVVARTTRAGSRGVRITRVDGSVIDITPSRVKEFVPHTHPNAPPGTLQRVRFNNAQPGSKGFKRNPTPDELKLLEQMLRRQ